MAAYRKWYGRNADGRLEYYKGLEGDTSEIFRKLSENVEIETAEEKPQPMPDLRTAMIEYGRIQLKKSLGEDWALVKMINVYFSMDEIINTLYEKSLALSLLLGNHSDKSVFFRQMIESGNSGMETIGRMGTEMILEKDRLWNEIERRTQEILPGACHLAGTATVCELLAHFGSLERLAMARSSSIQMAGAERSLFISKTKGVRNPKYGLIYKSRMVASAPPAKRGKVARKLAGKLSICIRSDYFRNPLKEEIIDKMIQSISQS